MIWVYFYDCVHFLSRIINNSNNSLFHFKEKKTNSETFKEIYMK